MSKRKADLLDEEQAEALADKHARSMGLPNFAALPGTQFQDTVWRLVMPVTHPIALLNLSTTSRAWARLAYELSHNNNLWRDFCARDFPDLMSWLSIDSTGAALPDGPKFPKWVLGVAPYAAIPTSDQTEADYANDLALIQRVPWRRFYQITHLAYRQCARLIASVHEHTVHAMQAPLAVRTRVMLYDATEISNGQGQVARANAGRYEMVPLSTTNVLMKMRAIWTEDDPHWISVDARRIARGYAPGVEDLPVPLAAFGMLSKLSSRGAQTVVGGEVGGGRMLGAVAFSKMAQMAMEHDRADLGDVNILSDLTLPYIMWVAARWAITVSPDVAVAGTFAGFVADRYRWHAMHIPDLRLLSDLRDQGYPDQVALRNLPPVIRQETNWLGLDAEGQPSFTQKSRPFLGQEIQTISCCANSAYECDACGEPVCAIASCITQHGCKK